MSDTFSGNRTENFRFHSLKNRIIIVVALMLIVLTTVLTYTSFLRYQADTRDRSASMLQNTVEQVAENIKRYFEEISRLSMNIYYNSTIMKIINMPPTDNSLTNLEYRRIVEDELRRLLFIGRNDVISCYIIGPDVFRVASKVDELEIDSDWEHAEWYHQALLGKKYSLLISDSDNQHMVCSIVRTISSSKNFSDIVAVMKINYNATGIIDICKLVQTGYDGQLCVLNENGMMIYGSVPDGLEHELPAFSDGVSYKKAGQEYMVNQAGIDNYGWRVLLIHPIKALESGAYQTLTRMVIISVITLAVISFAIYLLLKVTLLPLTQMIHKMQIIRQGNEDERMTIQRKDEIGYLALSINEMLNRIRKTREENTRLIRQVYESELLQQNIKMQLLTKQIRPHFIMNTLNMIAIEAEMGDIDRCTANIRRLSVILQTITYSETIGTLEKELNFVRNYLQLYQERYYDRLSFHIDVPENVLQLSFPMLLLQPLVENALLHGCEKTSLPTCISIQIAVEKENLLITVVDNAGGIPPDQLSALQQQLKQTDHKEKEKTSGIGLSNVQQRIKLLYGPQYGLQLDSQNGLTLVSIHIPCKLPERKAIGDV